MDVAGAILRSAGPATADMCTAARSVLGPQDAKASRPGSVSTARPRKGWRTTGIRSESVEAGGKRSGWRAWADIVHPPEILVQTGRKNWHELKAHERENAMKMEQKRLLLQRRARMGKGGRSWSGICAGWQQGGWRARYIAARSAVERAMWSSAFRGEELAGARRSAARICGAEHVELGGTSIEEGGPATVEGAVR